MMDKTRIACGVVGVGYLGRHHLRIYQELESCRLIGFCEVDPDRAREVSDQYGCERFGSIRELAEVCQAVSVVVPTDKHCEIAVPLLEAGCHLLIEKPLCVSNREAEMILHAAEEQSHHSGWPRRTLQPRSKLPESGG